MSEQTEWKFFGYQTPSGERDVQSWFDALDEEERDDALDALTYLKILPRHLWIRPKFAPLDCDLSEVRFKANTTNKIYRIYGTFWPEHIRMSYTFLLGTNKKKSNDVGGKAKAASRLRQLRGKQSDIHEFKF